MPVPYRLVFKSRSLRVPPELWREIIFLSLPLFTERPGSYARSRGRVASVCKLWHDRVYGDQTFWSRIYVDQDVDVLALDFTLSKCPTAPLDLHLVFDDLCLSGQAQVRSQLSVAEVIHSIMDRLVASSRRWQSFSLITEHPEAFLLVQERCSDLLVPWLKSLSLSYYLMDGYSNFSFNHPIYRSPIEPLLWFRGSMPSLVNLETRCSRLTPGVTSFLDNLVSIDISQGCNSAIFGWDFLHSLFSTAVCMRSLKISDISPVPYPSSGRLSSHSLLALDVNLEEDTFVAELMTLMVVPNLVQLTLRVVPSNLDILMNCGSLLAPVRHFCLHGDLGEGDSLFPFFDSMPLIQILDFEHTYDHVFTAYCDWTYSRDGEQRVQRCHTLSSLAVGMVEISDLVGLFKFQANRGSKVGRNSMPRRLRMDPRVASWEVVDFLWLKDNVHDFGVWFCPDTLLHSGPMFEDAQVLQMATSDHEIPFAQSIRSLPAELLTYILVLACGQYFGRTRLFVHTRSEVSLVCRLWRDTIVGCGAFWSSYILRPGKIRKAARLWLSRTQKCTMELRVEYGFDVYPMPASHRRKRQLSVNEFLRIFVKIMPRVGRLRILAPSTGVLDALISAIRAIDLPHLTYLSFCVQLPTSTPPSTASRPIDGAFVCAVRGPTVVRFCGAALSWKIPSYYANVTTLVLELLAEGVAPDVYSLHSVLQTARSLVRLSLDSVVLVGSIRGLETVVMPCLEEIHVGMAGNSQLADLLSIVRAPLLSALYIRLVLRWDLHLLQRWAGLLEPVSSLVIDQARGKGEWLDVVRPMLPNLVRLNLAWSGPRFFRAMLANHEVLQGLWPSLRFLIVADMDFVDLKEFLEIRGSVNASLEVIRVSYTVDQEFKMEEAEVAWLQSKAVTLELDAELDVPWQVVEMVGLGFTILAESPLREESPEPEFSESTFLLLASYWPSPKHPHRKSLPYELWEKIFLYYCGQTGGFSTSGFDSARYDLCRKFGWWSTFIRFNTVFWTRVFVDFTSRPKSIARHIANIGSRPLSVEIDLDLAFTIVPGHTVNSSSFSEVMPCLTMLASTSRQWRDLTIYVNGGYFLVPIFNLLNSLDVQSLVTFHYQCPYLAGGIAVRESHRRPIFFGGKAPSLRYMTLTSAIIPWMPTYFSSLISLRLIHLPVSFWPTDVELVRALSASPSLEFLEICGSGVSDMVQSPVFSLPSLTTLTLSYGSSSLLRFFALADLPRISRLVITRFNEDLLELLKDKLWFMSSLESLRINGGFYDDYHVDLLMRSAPNVRELCVKHSDAYFNWIVHHSPSHFSNLEELTVGDVCPYSLLEYICRHGGIVRLVYHHELVEPLSTSDFLVMVCIRYMVRKLVTYPDVFALTEKVQVIKPQQTKACTRSQSIFLPSPYRAFVLLWVMSASVTSSLADYVQLVPVFSVEIISEILVSVALDRDLSADSIISGAKDIRNVLLSCKHFRAICRTVPEAWVNIAAIHLASIYVDVAPIWFENAVRLSRNRPLRIVYKLPLAVSVGVPMSDALRIWSLLFTHRPRWEAFHLLGSRRCRPPFVCVKHLAVTADFAHSTPNLRALTVDTPSRPFACPQHPPNDPVLVHVEKLQILSSCFALDLPVAGPLNLPIPVLCADLVRLDLDKQPLFNWQHILRYAPRLDELVWRSGNAIVGPAGSTTILLPLLRRLELESVHPLPPISTPRLQELIVTDQQTAFGGDKFNALVGSDPTHPLRVLDLLHNPIPNYDINFLLAKCQDLTYFSMDTLNRDR
ncbi:hypothetical protein DFH06DRAFT_1129768 [Mycena polygramma]|nr:hypothetical protein DFH06DRAFT_1129768 [Mycena polygramma]